MNRQHVGDLIAQTRVEEALNLLKEVAIEHNFQNQKNIIDKLLGDLKELNRVKRLGIISAEKERERNSNIVVSTLELKDEIADMLMHPQNQPILSSTPTNTNMARVPVLQLFFNCIEVYTDTIDNFIHVFPQITGELKLSMGDLLGLLLEYTGCTDPERMEQIPLEVEDHFSIVQAAMKEISKGQKAASLSYEKEIAALMSDSVPSWDNLQKAYELAKQHISVAGVIFPKVFSADVTGFLRRTLKQQINSAIKRSK